jgi:hypothetical protein
MPKSGDPLRGEFSIPAARHARAPLTARRLSRGWTVLSTLPNIRSHACANQILGLEEALSRMARPPRLYHVSADAAAHWHEVDHYHATLAAPGFTLEGCDGRSRSNFKDAFGVGVSGHRRIAHGLFALNRGVFVDAEIPVDQLRAPEIQDFVRRLRASMRAEGSGAPRRAPPSSRPGQRRHGRKDR